MHRDHDKLTRLGVSGYTFEDCLLDYRRAVLVGLNYRVQGYPVADLANPRTAALFDSGADRSPPR